jgi:hypothetical protein
MQYMLSLIRDDAAWEALSAEEKDARRAKVGAWFMEQAAAGRLQGGAELHGAESATTVRFERAKPLVIDGPFMESREVLGGFGLLEFDDLDAAIAAAKALPFDEGVTAVEIRPTVGR